MCYKKCYKKLLSLFLYLFGEPKNTTPGRLFTQNGPVSLYTYADLFVTHFVTHFVTLFVAHFVTLRPHASFQSLLDIQ